jgi:UDP-N-acetylmuramoylalanine--D-glutamate ligase
MIRVDYYPVTNKKYIVFGLARSGMATIQWLLEKGAIVYVVDRDENKQQQACQLGAHHLVPDNELDWSTIAAVIQSPGISPYHPFSELARSKGIPIITDCNLLRCAYPDAKFIGVTGTNGKSTTTALIGHILSSSGYQVAIGGNLGVPALSLPATGHNDYFVLELSSYQLELSDPLSLTISAWINISEDHLERHGSIENYVKIKQRIFAFHSQPGMAVVGIDDPWSYHVYQELSKRLPGKVIAVSNQSPVLGGIYAYDHFLIDDLNQHQESILPLSDLRSLSGIHNYQNIAIAYAVCLKLGVAKENIVHGIRTFPGLAHRQELVATIKNLKFINDSKATNAVAAAKALATYDNIYWIVGGQDKSDGIDPLEPYFGKVRHAFLIGAAQERFARTLKDKVNFTLSQNLELAIVQAYNAAQEKKESTPAVVLLSPACASYDQFQDFEHRGDVFRAEVKKLEKKGC